MMKAVCMKTDSVPGQLPLSEIFPKHPLSTPSTSSSFDTEIVSCKSWTSSQFYSATVSDSQKQNGKNTNKEEIKLSPIIKQTISRVMISHPPWERGEGFTQGSRMWRFPWTTTDRDPVVEVRLQMKRYRLSTYMHPKICTMCNALLRNYRGFKNKASQLAPVLNQYISQVVSLQETIMMDQPGPLIFYNYLSYRRYDGYGMAIYVHKYPPYPAVRLNSATCILADRILYNPLFSSPKMWKRCKGYHY